MLGPQMCAVRAGSWVDGGGMDVRICQVRVLDVSIARAIGSRNNLPLSPQTVPQGPGLWQSCAGCSQVDRLRIPPDDGRGGE